MTETNTLTRADLITLISTDTALSRHASAHLLDALEEAMRHALRNGTDVRLFGLGTLAVKETAARTGTFGGKAYAKPAGRKVAFRPSKDLREAIGG